MPDVAVGVDVGGTKITAGVLDATAKIITRHSVRSHAGRPPHEVVDAIVEATGAALKRAGLTRSDVAGVGVGFAGHVNGVAGTVLTSSNLPAWDNHPLRDVLQERLCVAVVLENDANCAAWAEYRYGANFGQYRERWQSQALDELCRYLAEVTGDMTYDKIVEAAF